VTLVLVLLKQLQPFLSSANLSVQPPATQTIKAPSSAQKASNTFGRASNSVSHITGPQTMRLNATSNDELGNVNKVLNNVNVSSRNKNSDMATTLPPIQQKRN